MTFNTIGIIGKQPLPKMTETLEALIHFLEKKQKEVLISSDTASQLKNSRCTIMPIDKLAQKSDLVIVVGGDGSLLNAARTVALYNTPILGINLGRLGFLTDIKPSEIESKVHAILNNDFIKEERFLLDVIVENHGTQSSIALNEVVLSADKSPHMIDFEIYINDVFMYSQRSDGLIIATPTGSTAYALSAGGPIIHPSLNAIIMIPMFPHSLTNRPIVIDGNSKIRISLASNSKILARVICDSQTTLDITEKSTINIQKMKTPLQLIHPSDYNYYDALYSKLHWGKKIASE